MAKFRKVHTAFWDDPLIERLTPDVRYFYLFLMTNPLCTECGIYQITMKKMCDYTGYNEDAVKSIIKTLEIENSRIIYDLQNQEVCILKKPNYLGDKLGKPIIDCLTVEFRKIKNKVLIFKQLKHIEKETVRAVYGTLSAQYTVRGEEREEEKEEEKEREEIAPAPEISNNTALCIWNVEEIILANQIWFEQICVPSGKNIDECKKILRKYHLFLEEKHKYPTSKKSSFAGFERWLLNEATYYPAQNFKNGANKQPFAAGRDNPTGDNP